MELDKNQAYSRQAIVLLLVSCVLLILESAVYIHTRWVEDESWLSSGAWTLVHEGRIRSTIFPASPRYTVDVSPPVHTISMAAAFAAFGPGPAQARLVSAAAGLGLVVVVFLLGCEIQGPLCGAIAALLVATDTFLVIAARTARPEAATALLSWLAILLYYRGTRHNSWKLLLCSGLAAGVGMATHPLALPFVASIGLFLVFRYGPAVWRRPLAWAFVCGAGLAVLPYATWCFSDAAHIASFRDVYLAKAAESFHDRLIGEADRWGDFIGLSTQRVSIPVRIPVRLHIAVILAAAFVFLFRRRRDVAMSMTLILLLNVLWWLYMVNKGPRYLALISPIFAVILGYLVASGKGYRGRRLTIGLCSLVLATQVAANAFWIYRYRSADYSAVTRQLRQIVPPGASVYGATTFWMALYDRTYYAYDRTPFDYATHSLRPEYLIVNDRVMVNGSGHGQDDFAELRAQTTAFVREHGTLVGQLPNDFYGDLEVFRIRY
jgi:4-amino-4-deoxy-L-arabinose transferase-like glycosyltransferase